jgi:hypothetical protein
MGTQEKPERLAPGLTRERLAEGRVVAFTLMDLSEQTVDIWIKACLDEMAACIEQKRPILVLQDLARPGVIQTNYSRERGNEVTSAYPELDGRVAFVLMPGLVAQRVGRYVRGQSNEYRERRFFESRDEALAWLLSPAEDAETPD